MIGQIIEKTLCIYYLKSVTQCEMHLTFINRKCKEINLISIWLTVTPSWPKLHHQKVSDKEIKLTDFDYRL